MHPKSERGATLIMVAICLLGLTAFSAIVIDYGIMQTARTQAQGAADAAALAGAVAMTYDNTTTAEVKARARGAGRVNTVWLQQPDIQLSDIQLVPCPPTLTWPTTDTCIKADVYRNQARNNPLPIWFGGLAGITDQGVRATATARTVSGTSAACVKPWAVADKWFEGDGAPWDQLDTYDGVTAPADVYEAPTPSNNYRGSGFSATQADGVTPDYYGYQMVLKLDNPGQGGGSGQPPVIASGWAMEVCLENSAEPGNPCGTPAYTGNISGCSTQIVNISPWDAAPCTVIDPSIGCLGLKTGSTGANNAKALEEFIAANDPDAYWTDGTGAQSWQTGTITSEESPSSRIVPVAVFHVPEFVQQETDGKAVAVRIIKLVGFFIEGTCADNNYTKESYLKCPGGGSDKAAIVGRLVNYAATGSTGPSIGGFGKILTLVR